MEAIVYILHAFTVSSPLYLFSCEGSQMLQQSYPKSIENDVFCDIDFYRVGDKGSHDSHEVVSRKVLNGLKQKTACFKVLSKRRTAKTFVYRLLELLL